MLPRYQIVEPVGVDGHWRLYRALHRERGTSHGLAVTTAPTPGAIERLKPLISAQRAVEAAHVVTVHTFGGSPTRLWAASPWVEGVGLVPELADADEAPVILGAIARALVEARAWGVPHGDLGPAAVLLDAAPGGLEVRVARFGLAAAFGALAPDVDGPAFAALARRLGQDPALPVDRWAARPPGSARGRLWARVPELRRTLALDQEVAASAIFGRGAD